MLASGLTIVRNGVRLDYPFIEAIQSGLPLVDEYIVVVGKSDEPYSLMVGIAGDICFTIDVLNGSGYFPGYDL